MRIIINGYDLPGRYSCGSQNQVYDNVHVGVQVKRAPSGLVRGDAESAQWAIDVEVVANDTSTDFRGPAVQGKKGDRFVYLTWGHVDNHGGFEMFRRAKLMLNRIDPAVVSSGAASGELRCRVQLTDKFGAPRCARVDPPAIEWKTA